MTRTRPIVLLPPLQPERRRFLTGAATMLTAAALTSPVSLQGQPADTALFAYFTGNGEDGLRLARSHDGLAWTPVAGGRSFLTPSVGSRLMRDPSIVQGPDGMFHLVWTTGWWDQGIGIAHSKDLVTWTPQEVLPVMAHEPTAGLRRSSSMSPRAATSWSGQPPSPGGFHARRIPATTTMDDDSTIGCT
jgi:hypothetical protein